MMVVPSIARRQWRLCFPVDPLPKSEQSAPQTPPSWSKWKPVVSFGLPIVAMVTGFAAWTSWTADPALSIHPLSNDHGFHGRQTWLKPRAPPASEESGQATVSSSSPTSLTSLPPATHSTQSTGATATTFPIGATVTVPANRPLATASPERPVLAIKYPRIISACLRDDIRVEWGATTGRSLAFMVEYLGSNTTIANAIANRFQQRTRQPRMELQSHWFTNTSEPLMFRVTAYESFEQFGDRYSSSQVITIARAGGTVPTLEQSERLHVVGPNDMIRAKANIRFPPCTNVNTSQAVVSYAWKLFKSDGPEIDMTSLPNAQGLANRNVGFRLSPLDYGTYELQSVVVYNGVTVAASSRVHIVPSDMRMAINGGNYQVMTTSRNNTLSISIFDPDSSAISPRSYAVSWLQCPLDRSGCTVIANTRNYTIPANTLAAGSGSVYAVIIQDDQNANRKASDMAYIEGSSTVLPRLIAARSPARSQVSVGEDVIVYVRVVDIVTGARVTEIQGYSWAISPRSVSGIGETLPGRRGDSFYVIPKNTFSVGTDVTLRVTATLAGNVTVSTDMRVQYAELPSGGSLSVLNDRTGLEGGLGIGFSDTFTFITTGWTGGLPPYSYNFGFTFSNGQGGSARELDKFVAFGLASPSKSNVRFPPSADKAFVIVTDSAGSRVRVNTSLTLTRPIGQNVQSLITAAQNRAENLRAFLAASPDDAFSELADLLDMLDTRNVPATPSASERQQLASLQKQVSAWMVNAATSRESVDAGFSAQSASMLNNLDLSTIYADTASLSNTVELIQLAVAGAKVGRGGALIRADPEVTNQLAMVIDDLLKRLFAAATSGLALRRRGEGLDVVHTLVRRQASLEAQLRANAASLLSSAIAGDSCEISGVTVPVIGPQGAFWGAARRITPSGSESNDIPRTVGNFTVTLPSNLPSGCWDSLLIQWRQARGSEVPASRIISPSVLSINIYNSGSTSAGPNLSSNIVRFAVSNLAEVPSGQVAKCVGFVSNAWTSNGCETSGYAGSSVTCDCNMAATEFAVQAQPNASGSPTPTPGPSGGDNAGAITGGVIGGVAGICVLGGGLVWYRRRHMGYQAA